MADIDSRVDARSVKLLLDDDVPIEVWTRMPKWLRDADKDTLEHLYAALAAKEKAEAALRELREAAVGHEVYDKQGFVTGMFGLVTNIIEKRGVRL